jgi:riboflavin biosynthesis pyrimidine reductase
VYANFIASLDGRIAIPDPEKPGLAVPEAIANPRDWRLFQELAAQADIMITSGRYLREHAAGRAQEILRTFDDPEFSDLKAWRITNGLRPQPDLAVISADLDFKIPDGLTADGRKVVVITGANADPRRVRALEAQVDRVMTAGEDWVDGRRLAKALHRLGYALIYSTAGPKVLHTLLSAGALNRLYLTHAHRMLGGQEFASVVDGPLLTPPADFDLKALYFDPHALEGHGQLLTVYETARLSGS